MDDRLRMYQLKNLEAKIGCVQCGMPSTRQIGKYECCDSISCRVYLRRITRPEHLKLDDLFSHELSGCKLWELDC